MATTLNSGFVAALKDIEPGGIVQLKENGALVDFYVACHDYESGLNGAGRTLLVRKTCHSRRAFNGGTTNAYASSELVSWLNSTYKALLDATVQSAMGTTKIYYTPGQSNFSVTTGSWAVFFLSLTELGLSGAYANVEGTRVSGYAAIRNAGATYWSRTVCTKSYAAGYYELNETGTGTTQGGANYDSSGVRPAFTLPANTVIKEDGSIVIDSAPVLTSSTADGADLGTKTEGWDLTYTLTDADSDVLTVKEYLDDTLQRTYTATLGSANTFQATSPDNFQRVLNGSHTIRIEAADGCYTTTLTATFVKSVTTATITLKEPLSVEGDISVAVLAVTAVLPYDAVYKVEATNNAKDASPVWQDVTTEVKLGQNILFSNSVCTNGAAFNFRITASRGPSDTAGSISVVSGAFQ